MDLRSYNRKIQGMIGLNEISKDISRIVFVLSLFLCVCFFRFALHSLLLLFVFYSGFFYMLAIVCHIHIWTNSGKKTISRVIMVFQVGTEHLISTNEILILGTYTASFVRLIFNHSFNNIKLRPKEFSYLRLMVLTEFVQTACQWFLLKSFHGCWNIWWITNLKKNSFNMVCGLFARMLRAGC